MFSLQSYEECHEYFDAVERDFLISDMILYSGIFNSKIRTQKFNQIWEPSVETLYFWGNQKARKCCLTVFQRSRTCGWKIFGMLLHRVLQEIGVSIAFLCAVCFALTLPRRSCCIMGCEKHVVHLFTWDGASLRLELLFCMGLGSMFWINALKSTNIDDHSRMV